MRILKSDAIAKAGSASKLARVLGISRQAVHKWPDTLPQGRAYELAYKWPRWAKALQSRA